jgi:hypothetical protein
MKKVAILALTLVGLFGCTSAPTIPPEKIGSIIAFEDVSKEKNNPILQEIELPITLQNVSGYPALNIFSEPPKEIGIRLQLENAILLRNELEKVVSGEKELSSLKVKLDKGLWHSAAYVPVKTKNGDQTFMVASIEGGVVLFSKPQFPQLIEALNHFIKKQSVAK